MDKVIVITGASAGIGAELARQLGAKGAKLVLAARRKTELEAVATQSGPETLAVVTDVTGRADVDRLRDAALSDSGKWIVWVNNAGRGIARSVAELSDADLETMIRDNVTSALYGIQAVLPRLRSGATRGKSSMSPAAWAGYPSRLSAPRTPLPRAR